MPDIIDEMAGRIICLEASVLTLINRVDETQRRAVQQEILKFIEQQQDVDVDDAHRIDDAHQALAIAAVNRLFPPLR